MKIKKKMGGGSGRGGGVSGWGVRVDVNGEVVKLLRKFKKKKNIFFLGGGSGQGGGSGWGVRVDVNEEVKFL